MTNIVIINDKEDHFTESFVHFQDKDTGPKDSFYQASFCTAHDQTTLCLSFRDASHNKAAQALELLNDAGLEAEIKGTTNTRFNIAFKADIVDRTTLPKAIDALAQLTERPDGQVLPTVINTDQAEAILDAYESNKHEIFTPVGQG